MSWTCNTVLAALHWGRGSIPTHGVYSAVIPLGKGLTVHYLVFSDLRIRLQTDSPISVHTSHYTHVKMMDDSTPTHNQRKLVKTYKNVLPQKWTVVAEGCGETYSKKR